MNLMSSTAVIPVFSGQGITALPQLKALNDSKLPAVKTFIHSAAENLLLLSSNLGFTFNLLSVLDGELDPPNHAAISGSLLCITQIAQSIALLESKSIQFNDIKECAGFCSGIISAIAVAASSEIVDLLKNGIETLKFAFWVGFHVQNEKEKLFGLTSSSWTSAIIGLPRQQISDLIADFNQKIEEKIHHIFISAVTSDTCISVSGEPNYLKTFCRALQKFSATIRFTNIQVPYHSTIILQSAAERIVQDAAKFDFPTGLKIPIRSTIDGSLLDANNITINQVVSMILEDICQWDLVAKQIAVDLAQCSIKDVNVLAIGPITSTANQIVEVINRSGDTHAQLVDFTDGHVKYKADPFEGKVAVIGMSCRFAGANSPEEFWKVLENGLNMVREVPNYRFDINDYYCKDKSKPNSLYTKWGNFIDCADKFDPRFFNISPREAINMDPQQRILLQVAYEALEAAGYTPDSTPSSDRSTFGCFLGASTNDYTDNLCQNIDAYYATGTLKAFLSGRISYYFGWSGPSITMDTACSSGLVSLHYACQSLLTGECNAAIAGGVNIITSPDLYIGLGRGSFLSPTGGCKSFDASADGYCRGEGCGLFVLKRLSDAIADRDPIIGTISASAVNQSGTTHSITFPHANTQAELYKKTCEIAGLHPHEVSVVEAHGTGTQAGDPIEMQSIRTWYAQKRSANNPLFVGSVKANIGHAETASGAAAAIKVLLMLQHKKIPPQVGFQSLNPKIPPIEPDNIVISKTCQDWKSSKLAASVNNYGAAGSNASVLIEEAPQCYIRNELDPRSAIVTLSAKSIDSLERMRKNLLSFLDANPNVPIQDIGYTTTARRMHYPHRLAVVANSIDELRKQLHQVTVSADTKEIQFAFVFSGQGSQYIGMCKELYDTEPSFKSNIDKCQSLLMSIGFEGFLQYIYAPEAKELSDPKVVQPAIVAIGYSLAQLWMTWGVKPDFTIGHSLGEYIAAIISGILSLEDALWLTAHRAQLMSKHCASKTGGMLSINTDLDTVKAILSSLESHELCIGCINSPQDIVVSGPNADIDRLEDYIKSNSICKCVRISVTHAFHSGAMEPMLEKYGEITSQVTFKSPIIPIVSNMNGNVIISNGTYNAEYFVQHVRNTVRFSDGIKSLVNNTSKSKKLVWIEIGAHPVCTPMIKTTLLTIPSESWASMVSNRKQASPWKILNENLRQLYVHGFAVNWHGYHRAFSKSLQVIKLPSYPFNEASFWVNYKDRGLLPESNIKPVQKAAVDKPKYTLLESVVKMPNNNDKMAIFESSTGSEMLTRFIVGHSVLGYALCPASVYVELALSAARHLCSADQGVFTVKDLSILSPLVRQDSARTIRLQMQYSKTDSVYPFEIFSYVPGKIEGKIRHAHGKVITNTESSLKLSFGRIQQMVIGCTNNFTSDSDKILQTLHCRMIYNTFSRVVSYSPDYQGMKRIAIRDNGLEGYAKIKLEKSTGGLFCVHPFLQDCFLQVAGFVANVSDLCSFDEVLLAIKVEEAQFLPQDIPETADLDVYTNLIMVDRENVIGDVYILTKTGNIVGRIGGAHFKKIRTPILKRILDMAVRQSAQPNDTGSSGTSSAVVQKTTLIKSNSNQIPQSIKGNQDFVVKVVADCLGVAENAVSNDASLIEMGIDSLMSIELIARLQSFVPSAKLSSSLFMDCHTIGEVKRYLAALSPTTVSGTSIIDEQVVSIKNDISLSQIRGIIAEALGVNAAEIDPDTQLAELGVDSLMSIELRSKLQDLTANELPSNFLIDYSTLQSVYKYFEHLSQTMSYSSVVSFSSCEEIDEAQKYSIQDIRSSIRSLLASLLCVESDEIKDNDSLADLGIDSLMSIELASKLSNDFGLTLATSDLMNYISFDDLASDIERISEGISQISQRTVKSQVTVSNLSTNTSTRVTKPSFRKGQLNVSTGIADVIDAMNSVQQLFPEKASETGLKGFINEVDPKQNQLVLRYIVDAFSQLGCDLVSMTPGTLIPPMNMILSEHARLKSRLFDILEWMGVINRESGDIYVRSNQDLGNVPASDILLQDLCSRYPVFETDNLLLSKTGSKLADCITGRASPLEILFKNEEASNLMFKFYCDSPMFSTAVMLLNEILQRLLSVPNDEPIRIIEIGGGTGGTTAKILPILQRLNRKIKYTFTDISKAFVLKAKKKFAAYDFLDYTACNIEELPENFADGAVYDIVIATNVIHATQNIRHTLTNINELLTKNGVLILSELTKDLYWFDLVFGLLSGWWHFTDTDVRNHAIMQPEVWREQLVSTGFHEVAWAQSSSSDIAVQRIIVGRKTLDGKQRVNALNEPVTVSNKNNSPAVDFLKAHAAMNSSKSSKPAQPKHIENTQFNAKNNLVTITATPFLGDNYTVAMANLCQAYYTGMYLPVNAIRSHIYFEKVLNFDLNVERFQKSVDISLSRHPILRSRVHNGQFHINPCSENYVVDKVIDLYGKQERQINETIQFIRNQRLTATFGEDKRHFWYCIIHINKQKSILVLDADAIILDFASVLTWCKELAACYFGESHNLPSAATLTYGHYITTYLQLQRLEDYSKAQRDYWWKRINSLPEATKLPKKDNLPSFAKSPGFEVRRTGISANEWERVSKSITSRGLQVSTALSVLFAEVIAMYTGTDHLCINIMFLNRLPLHEQVWSIMGNFNSTLLLEFDFRNEEESLETRIRRTQKLFLQDLENSTLVTATEVISELNSRRGSLMEPYSTIAFVSLLPFQKQLKNLSERDRTFFFDPVYENEVQYSVLETAGMEIDHQVGLDKNGDLVMNWDSIRDVFPDDMIQEMVDMFRIKVLELSESLTWDATTRELGLPLNLEGRILANATTTGLIHSQFIQMAISHPEYTAIISPDKKIAYGELLSMTIQLANYIKKNYEIQHGDLVCISMPRCWEEIVAVVSVVLAGGAYVPVDASLPIERRQAIYGMTKTKLIMTSCELAVLDSTPVLRIDDFFTKESHAVIDNIPPQTNIQDDVAYVIFTSGSTGTPKGVVISHRAAVNTISDINQRFSVTSEDRTLALASLSFDLSVWDIFGLLSCGGAIVMPSEDGRRDPADWVKAIKEHHVTVWNSVPQLVDVVVLWINSSQNDSVSDCFASIRLIMMSGDWIPVNLPKNIRELSSRHRQANSITKEPLRVISLGGATEASIWSVYHEIDESFNLDGTASSVPYGRPLSNQTCHVLDKHLKRCPSHVIGDLYIGGAGLALGYYNAPELTQKAFFIHPKTGERLYRTGDLAKYLPNGDLIFCGRADFQVKVQGYRIELGEISAALETHSEVKTSVASVIGSKSSGTCLIAYYILKNSGSVCERALRDLIASKVPSYMVPSYLVEIDAIPLTVNGKVDLKRLPVPTISEKKEDVDTSSHTETQVTIYAIWKDVLQTDSVDFNSNFLDVGGNSFALLHMRGKIQKHFGVNVPLPSLMKNFTIHSLSLEVDQLVSRCRPSVWDPIVPIQTQGENSAIFLVHPSGGNVFCYTELSKNLGGNQPIYGLQAYGFEPEHEDPVESICDIASSYVTAMKRVQPVGPYHLGGWSSGGLVAIEMAIQLLNSGESISHIFMLDSPAPGGYGGEPSEEQLRKWFYDDVTGLEKADSNTELDGRGLKVFGSIIRAERKWKPLLVKKQIAESIQIVLFRATDTKEQSELLLHSSAEKEDWGWRSVLQESFGCDLSNIFMVKGDHFSIMKPPAIGQIANNIKNLLEREQLDKNESADAHR